MRAAQHRAVKAWIGVDKRGKGKAGVAKTRMGAVSQRPEWERHSKALMSAGKHSQVSQRHGIELIGYEKQGASNKFYYRR